MEFEGDLLIERSRCKLLEWRQGLKNALGVSAGVCDKLETVLLIGLDLHETQNSKLLVWCYHKLQSHLWWRLAFGDKRRATATREPGQANALNGRARLIPLVQRISFGSRLTFGWIRRRRLVKACTRYQTMSTG